MKTGFTNEAGYNLVGSATQNGLRLIVVVTGLKNAKDRADEAKKLLEYGFQELRLPHPVRREPDRGRSQGLWRRAGQGAGHRQGQQIKLMVPRGVSERIVAKMVYIGPVRAPVREGPADRPPAGLARRHQGAGSAVAGHRKRCRSARRRSAPSTPPRNLWSTCFALPPSGYKATVRAPQARHARL